MDDGRRSRPELAGVGPGPGGPLGAGFAVLLLAGRERSHELGVILGTGTRMLLQAKVLRMKHPHSGEDLVIEAPPDEDFCRCFPQGVADMHSMRPLP